MVSKAASLMRWFKRPLLSARRMISLCHLASASAFSHGVTWRQPLHLHMVL
jgi:hypothetical protein